MTEDLEEEEEEEWLDDDAQNDWTFVEEMTDGSSQR